jgi:hypothetical protein
VPLTVTAPSDSAAPAQGGERRYRGSGRARQPLERDYAQAWQGWEASGEQQAWESVTGDGLADAAR